MTAGEPAAGTGLRMLYSRPASLDAALAVLGADAGARCLAGGATLVAGMNAGLPKPSQVVSLQDIPGLRGMIVEADGAVRIAAMTVHAAVAAESRLAGGLAVVREAALQIAHPAIRNMGTLGGSLADADPNADYPCALLAAGADIELAGPRGRRICPVDAFFLGRFTTALAAGEIIVGVKLPPPALEETSTYLKFSRVDGDYATVSVAVRMGWRDRGWGLRGRVRSAERFSRHGRLSPHDHPGPAGTCGSQRSQCRSRDQIMSTDRTTLSFHVNCDPQAVAIPIHRTLLEVLRDELALTGAKKGCNTGTCGACNVLVDDVMIRSCLRLAVSVAECKVTTVEGLAR